MIRDTPEKFNERLARRDREDLLSILKTPYGRRFVWRWMGKSGVFRQSFIAGSPDMTAFQEGQRNVGNTLLSEVLDVRPEAYLLMQKQAKEDELEALRISQNVEES